MCVTVYWFHTPELSRSLASDQSGLLAMTTSFKIATDVLLAIEHPSFLDTVPSNSFETWHDIDRYESKING